MANLVYILCSVACIACALLLFRGYFRTYAPLLLWSGMCFGLFAVNNALLVIDVVIMPEIDFHGLLWRNALGAAAGMVLLFGLIWELT